MFVYSKNPYIKILTPNVMVFDGGAFGRGSGHEDGALMNGVSALIKDPKEFSGTLPPCQVTRRRWAAYKSGSGLRH